MAVRKSKERKKHLGRALRVNKKAPLWTFMKTKKRSILRGRKRSWRHQKLRRVMKKAWKE